MKNEISFEKRQLTEDKSKSTSTRSEVVVSQAPSRPFSINTAKKVPNDSESQTVSAEKVSVISFFWGRHSHWSLRIKANDRHLHPGWLVFGDRSKGGCRLSGICECEVRWASRTSNPIQRAYKPSNQSPVPIGLTEPRNVLLFRVLDLLIRSSYICANYPRAQNKLS